MPSKDRKQQSNNIILRGRSVSSLRKQVGGNYGKKFFIVADSKGSFALGDDDKVDFHSHLTTSL